MFVELKKYFAIFFEFFFFSLHSMHGVSQIFTFADKMLSFYSFHVSQHSHDTFFYVSLRVSYSEWGFEETL